MTFKSLRNLSDDIQFRLLPQLPRDISTVFGIPRSGMIPAAILATALGAKLGVAGGAPFFGSRHKHKVLPEGGKTLLVDDSIHTGNAMLAASATVGMDRAIDYRCVVYAHSQSRHCVDFYAEVLDGARIFQWNFTGIKASERYCWEMDDVICTAPAIDATDGDRYANHLLHDLKPLYLPQVRVKAIVSGRRERWRPATEGWLRRYGVQYEELVMQPPTPTGKPRESTDAAAFKTRHFLRLDGPVFIEGDDAAAEQIAALSGRSVLSLQSMTLFGRRGPEGPSRSTSGPA